MTNGSPEISIYLRIFYEMGIKKTAPTRAVSGMALGSHPSLRLCNY